MKSLVEFIRESIICESEEKELRFTFSDLKDSDERLDSVKKAAESKGIYVEKVDGGLKMKAKPSDVDKWDGVQDILQQYVQSLQDDEEADQDKVKKLADQVNTLNDWIDEVESNEGE